MRSLIVAVFLSGFALAQTSAPSAFAGDGGGPDASSTSPATASPALPDLPPMPKGKATVIGGAIRNLDDLRDQLTVDVYGGRGMKVLFDERTEVYRDGQRIKLRDLKKGERVSLETVLDGTAVFARSIHVLTSTLEGECSGQVVSFNRSNGELLVRDALASDPIKIRVPAGIGLTAQGRTANPSDLMTGSLVSVKFWPDGQGGSVARQIAILATPGSSFVFSGIVSYFDMHAGKLALVDPRDQQHYEVSFPPGLPGSQDLHEGADVTVTANFEGSHYSANKLVINNTANNPNK